MRGFRTGRPRPLVRVGDVLANMVLLASLSTSCGIIPLYRRGNVPTIVGCEAFRAPRSSHRPEDATAGRPDRRSERPPLSGGREAPRGRARLFGGPVPRVSHRARRTAAGGGGGTSGGVRAQRSRSRAAPQLVRPALARLRERLLGAAGGIGNGVADHRRRRVRDHHRGDGAVERAASLLPGAPRQRRRPEAPGDGPGHLHRGARDREGKRDRVRDPDPRVGPRRSAKALGGRHGPRGRAPAIGEGPLRHAVHADR